jgi:hypothetical protein
MQQPQTTKRLRAHAGPDENQRARRRRRRSKRTKDKEKNIEKLQGNNQNQKLEDRWPTNQPHQQPKETSSKPKTQQQKTDIQTAKQKTKTHRKNADCFMQTHA